MTDETTLTDIDTELAAPEHVELADPFGALLEAIEKAEKPETLDKLIQGLDPALAYDETANLTDDQRLELRLKAERKRYHMLPLPNYRIDGVPEGAALMVRGPNGELRSAERHDEVFLTQEELKGLLADGYKLAMLPHIPHEHLPPSVLFGTGDSSAPDYSELPVPEDAHPEIRARLEAENENRRALKALDEEHARIAEENVQREKEERARYEAEQAAKRAAAAEPAPAPAPAAEPAPAPAAEPAAAPATESSSSSKKKKSG